MLPANAMMAPAVSGPTIREVFMAIALSASAEESDSLGTISGTIAAKIGQRIARPIPLVKVKKRSR